jgi:hypothetical protein
LTSAKAAATEALSPACATCWNFSVALAMRADRAGRPDACG